MPLGLLDSLHEAIAETEILRRDKRQRIAIHGDAAAAEARILGEATKIRRLLVNLLDNASRYAPEGSEIEAGISLTAGAVELAVTNPGKSIPQELRERVFDPYYRLPGSGSEGSGLGLAIVKEIARQHHATVRVSTRSENEGTVVRVRLNLDGAKERSVAEKTAAVTECPTESCSSRARSARAAACSLRAARRAGTR